MIKSVFFEEGKTYLKDENDVEICTSALNMSQAFELAVNSFANFDYGVVNKYDLLKIDSYFFEYGCTGSKSIIWFFDECVVCGIYNIIGCDGKLFGLSGIKKAVDRLIDHDGCGYDVNCAIAMTVHDILESLKPTTKIEALMRFVGVYDYDLDGFLDLLKEFNCGDKVLNRFKNEFENDYTKSPEALENYIGAIVNFAGDNSEKIYNAMVDVLNDIINDESSTNKNGMIEYLKECDNYE